MAVTKRGMAAPTAKLPARTATQSRSRKRLTFDTKGEIIIFVGRNRSFARTLDAVLALLAHLFFLR
jgi:hypothetical protein